MGVSQDPEPVYRVREPLSMGKAGYVQGAVQGGLVILLLNVRLYNKGLEPH